MAIFRLTIIFISDEDGAIVLTLSSGARALSDETGDAKLCGADAVVVAEGATALADDHGPHVARHRVEPSLCHAGWLGQQRDSV